MKILWFLKKNVILCIGRDVENETFLKMYVKNSKEEVILGITVDDKLNFDNHIRNMCKTSGQKLNALSRISTLLNKDQKRIIFNAMIKSQFSCCPLIWMFSSRQSNNLISKVSYSAIFRHIQT